MRIFYIAICDACGGASVGDTQSIHCVHGAGSSQSCRPYGDTD
jgi:hypothetical protein